MTATWAAPDASAPARALDREPLDLAAVRAQDDESRRRGLLGRLSLACRADETDAVREVGRLSTGYTDEELGSPASGRGVWSG